MAQELVKENCFPVRMVCDFLDLAASSYYYQTKENVAEPQLKADLKLVAGQHPVYGTRRLTHQLRRKPYEYNTPLIANGSSAWHAQ